MNILITGGLGFIGTRLARRLLEPGPAQAGTATDAGAPHIVLLDLPGTPVPSLLREPLDSGQLAVERGSVLDADLVNKLVAKADEVYHLAAIVGVRKVMSDPQRVIRVNFDGAANIIDAATEWMTPLLLVSSSEVAGKYRGSAFVEDADRLMGPTSELRWSYAGSKSLAEQYALAAHRQRGLPVVAVRLFNVVGPGQCADNGMVIPTFFQQALRGEPITVIGDGSQHRSFSYVDDVVDICVRLLRETAAYGRIVNVGAVQPVSILELAQRIRDLTGSASSISFITYEEAYGLPRSQGDGVRNGGKPRSGGPDEESHRRELPSLVPNGNQYPEVMFRVPNLARAKDLVGEIHQTPLDAILRDFLDHVLSEERQG